MIVSGTHAELIASTEIPGLDDYWWETDTAVMRNGQLCYAYRIGNGTDLYDELPAEACTADPTFAWCIPVGSGPEPQPPNPPYNPNCVVVRVCNTPEEGQTLEWSEAIGGFIAVDPSGGALQYEAGDTIGGNRVVMLDAIGGVVHFDPSVEANYYRIVGISINSALVGQTVSVKKQGPMTGFGGPLTPGQPSYAGPNGTLVTSVPSSGIVVCIGAAIDAATLDVELHMPIVAIP